MSIVAGLRRLPGDDARTRELEAVRAAHEVKSGTEKVAHGNASLSQRTEEQASSLEETASSMEEMTSTVKQNADDAQQANPLALNAAVEAARAGAQGRGFAVVASEVRNLASRSTEAAKEIEALLRDSVGKVDDGAKLIEQSGATLTEIVGAVKKVADIVAEIAAASLEQSAGIEQVDKAVMSIDEATQQNAALVEEAAAAADSAAGREPRGGGSYAALEVGVGRPPFAGRERRVGEVRRRAAHGAVQHQVVGEAEVLDREAVAALPRAVGTLRHGTAEPLDRTLRERSRIATVGEQRPPERAQESHLEGRTDVRAGPAERRHVDDAGIAVVHRALQRVVDHERLHAGRQAGIHVDDVERVDAVQPVARADRDLEPADLAGVRREDVRPGQVDLLQRACLADCGTRSLRGFMPVRESGERLRSRCAERLIQSSAPARSPLTTARGSPGSQSTTVCLYRASVALRSAVHTRSSVARSGAALHAALLTEESFEHPAFCRG